MPWWVMLILIVAGCFVLAGIMLLPFAYAYGAVFGSVVRSRKAIATLSDP